MKRILICAGVLVLTAACGHEGHNTNRIQVSAGRNNIIQRQVRMPKIGTVGTKGVLKARCTSGILLRTINTAAQTNVKANKVPILVISPATRAGTNAASPPTMTMNNKLLCAGVRYFS